MGKILCIYPYDKTTLFLNKIVKVLEERLGENFNTFQVGTNVNSHEKCLKEIRKAEFETILFLGHGRSDALYGASSDESDNELELSREDIDNNPNYFSKQDFVTRHNISKFSDKKVFCLSCRSAEILGHAAISEDARVFVGFGVIPTDEIDYKEDNVLTESQVRLMYRFRNALNKIILQSIIISLEQNLNFEQLCQLIKILTNRYIYVLLEESSMVNKHIVVNNLIQFKNEMKLFGNASLKLLDS